MEKLKFCKIKSHDDKLMPKMSDCPVCLFSLDNSGNKYRLYPTLWGAGIFTLVEDGQRIK